MKAFVLAAGLGTRLKPWTLEHPKALVPVGGVPMLQRVIDRLADQGVDSFVINAHHFADQIDGWVEANRDRMQAAGCSMAVSDERAALLDTGGGVLHAEALLRDKSDASGSGIDSEDECFIVHNVDILSNADIASLVRYHRESGNDVTLLVSSRDSSRGLYFDADFRLVGWGNNKTGQMRPEGFTPGISDRLYAFSGISVMSHTVFEAMRRSGLGDAFGIVDFILHCKDSLRIGAYVSHNLQLIDIGKPDTLAHAESIMR